MGLSSFNWSILYDNKTVIKVYTSDPNVALSVGYKQTKREQPLALIRGDCISKDEDAIEGD